MKVFIITEGSKDIGFGHITRCISLYQAFQEQGIEPEFIVNGDDTVREFFNGKKHKFFNWIDEKEKFFKAIKHADVAIVDSYLADIDTYLRISKEVKTPAYIDDYMRLDYPRGTVVNGVIYAEEFDYPKKNNVLYLLGVKYIPIRKEFWNPPVKKIKRSIGCILVSFGGDDSRNLTPSVLVLLNKEYPGITKKVIIGKGFNHISKIEKEAHDNGDLIYFPDAYGMRKVMLESDIAISAGGQTTYELARIGVPTIGVIVSDNQANNVNGWEKAGFMECAGWWDDEKLLQNIDNCINNLSDKASREKKHKIGRMYVDGFGSRRVVQSLLSI